MMEVENIMSSAVSKEEEEEDDDVSLPGFRFHPTDEELVGFYLRRKVEKRPIRLDLIKLVDIYKFDPWDLPRESKGVGEKEKEWYFFCKRGRKYKNSVRPNRVTRSGFWKATGIDRPIYSSTRDCIGLKKSLVYYRGSAGKGTKTDWMMHEFRLPTTHAKPPLLQEAEVWTLCRILKRSVSYRKCVPDWREMPSNKLVITDASSQTCSVESDQNTNINININTNGQTSSSSSYNIISFIRAPDPPPHKITHHHAAAAADAPLATQVQLQHHPSPSFVYGDINDFLRHADWEDLRSVVDCAAAATPSSYSLSQSQQYY